MHPFWISPSQGTCWLQIFVTSRDSHTSLHTSSTLPIRLLFYSPSSSILFCFFPNQEINVLLKWPPETRISFYHSGQSPLITARSLPNLGSYPLSRTELLYSAPHLPPHISYIQLIILCDFCQLQHYPNTRYTFPSHPFSTFWKVSLSGLLLHPHQTNSNLNAWTRSSIIILSVGTGLRGQVVNSQSSYVLNMSELITRQICNQISASTNFYFRDFYFYPIPQPLGITHYSDLHLTLGLTSQVLSAVSHLLRFKKELIQCSTAIF